MGESDPAPTHVSNVDRSVITDPYRLRASIAMQAVAQFVNKDPRFEETNQELRAIAIATRTAWTPTYEDVIFSNPLAEGGYVMSRDPEIARHEVGFYRGHARMEAELATTIKAILSKETDMAVLGIQRATKMFQSEFKGPLDPQAFSAFRPYFNGINTYPGTSGLYTAAIPIIDLLTSGIRHFAKAEPARVLEDVDRRLYPRHQADLLRTLLRVVDPRVEMPRADRERLATHIAGFRTAHLSVVRRFVPGALNAGTEGTGGVKNVKEYLDSKISNTKAGARHD